jgi:uncharacterized coiled-coil protein SlyX
MWKQIFELFTKVLTLTDRLDRIEKRMAEQQSEIKSLSELVNRVVFELARTNENIRHSQEREAAAREKFQLQIENQLLKANRQLPPTAKDET